MNKITKLSLVAVIYTALFNIPIFYLKSAIGNALIADFVMEMAIIIPITIILFFINPPIKYPTYLLQIASDCNIIFGCQKKKILGNYQ